MDAIEWIHSSRTPDKMQDLETKLIETVKQGKNISLERGLLILSGLRREEEIESYSQKLNQIHNGFITKLKARSPWMLSAASQYTVGSRAEFLFRYLWNTKPKRCNGNYLLTDVIDAQLDPDIDRKVGQCVGLTSLYSVLGEREDLELTILVRSEHMINRLRVDDTVYNIEHTDPLGFDCNLDEASFIEYPTIFLLAHIFNSRGMMKEKNKDFEEACKDYSNAIEINAEYANAFNNRGNMKSILKDYSGALSDYDRAIVLNTRFVEAYCNRGIVKDNLGDLSEAIQDFDRSIELDPGYVDAYLRRAIAKEDLGNYASAARDFSKVVELNPEFREKLGKRGSRNR